MAPYAPPIRRPLLISLPEGFSQSHLHPSQIQTMSPVVRIIIEMIVIIPEQAALSWHNARPTPIIISIITSSSSSSSRPYANLVANRRAHSA